MHVLEEGGRFEVITKSEEVATGQQEVLEHALSQTEHLVEVLVCVVDAEARLVAFLGVQRVHHVVLLEGLDRDEVIVLGDVVLVAARRRGCVHLDAEETLLVRHLHAHPIVVVVQLLGADASLRRLERLAYVVLGAIGVVVVVPDVEDGGATVRVAAAVRVASIPRQVASARTKRIFVDCDVHAYGVRLNKRAVNCDWLLLREGSHGSKKQQECCQLHVVYCFGAKVAIQI